MLADLLRLAVDTAIITTVLLQIRNNLQKYN